MSLTKVTYSMIQGATYNVLDYGAVGDGIANDTTAIQAALTAAFTAGGGSVYVPTGTYKITLPLIVRSNTSLYGDGASSVIYNTTTVLPPEGNVIHVGYGYEWNENGQKFNPASDNDATMAELLVNDFSNITTKNVSVSNLCVKTNGPGLGVWTLNASDVVIENIWSIDTLTPINVANDAAGWQAACYNVSVSNIFQISVAVGPNSWYDLVFVGSAIKVSISKCFNNPNTPSQLDGMIVISGGKYVNISDCHLIGEIPFVLGKRGVIVQNSSFNDASSNSITNNNIKSMLDGVFVNDSAENIISNNSIEDCSTGVIINSQANIVDSNTFKNNTMDLAGTNGLTRCQITNNRNLNNFVIAANEFNLQEYNNVSGNTRNTLPFNNHDTYPILKCRYLNFYPQDAFLSQADLAKTSTLGAIVTLNTAGSITLFYKIPEQVKKIIKLDVFGYSGTQFDKVTASIVGLDGPQNTNAFATIQSLGFFIPPINADYTLAFGPPTQTIDPFFNQGTYYIKILWEPTIFGGPPDLSSQLRGIQMIALCDD
jgi:parallel beta-helix repeat protein